MAEKIDEKEKKAKREGIEKKAEKKKEKTVKKTKEGSKESKKEKKEEKLPEEIHTINLREAYEKPRTRRARAAIQVIKGYVLKHKRKEARISPALNQIIWERGIEKPPRKIKVKLVVGKEEVIVYPVE